VTAEDREVRTGNAPLVSVGFPVYNGEEHLGEALASIVDQDYENLEIIVSDNASTDRTRDIVAEVAARDPRIRYSRSESNMGAPANFNRCLELATGSYFMWAADDDLRRPSYIRKCVSALQAHPDAVLACSQVRFIDEAGDLIAKDYTIFDNPDLSSRSVVDRVRTLVGRGGWYLIYGVMRRDAVARSRLYTGQYGGDVILDLELALMGPFVLVPEVLHLYRQIGGRTEADRVAGLDIEIAAFASNWWPYTLLQEGLSEAVAISRLPWPTKLRAQLEILLQAYVRDTPIGAHIRRETPARVRHAIRHGDVREFAKYAAAWLAGRIARGIRRDSGRIARGIRRASGRIARRIRRGASFSRAKDLRGRR
jgi:glycosyltransferase involved in cell wall biosynthesis